MNENKLPDELIAADVRAAVNKLNEALASASRANLSVRLCTTTHQTSGGAELIVVEAEILKRL